MRNHKTETPPAVSGGIYQSYNGYGKGKAKKQRAALAEIYGEDMAKQLWKLYGGKLDVVDWWEDQQ